MKTTTRRTKKNASAKRLIWERVGQVGVDSGQLVLCDPCYIDAEWLRDREPAGYDILVLSKAGREKFPELKFRAQFPFDWGTYEDVCPALGMSVNDATAAGLLDVVDMDPIREFSYRGACDVSRLKGEDFGQLMFKLGHAGAAVAFSSGYGDGIYPVFARRDSDGRIVEVRILMDPTPVQLKVLGLK